jgi:hypothetical protein
LLQDYEERRDEAYNTEELYVGLEDGVISLWDQRPYFPEHLYREAIRSYEDVINEAPVRDAEKIERSMETGDTGSLTESL